MTEATAHRRRHPDTGRDPVPHGDQRVRFASAPPGALARCRRGHRHAVLPASFRAPARGAPRRLPRGAHPGERQEPPDGAPGGGRRPATGGGADARDPRAGRQGPEGREGGQGRRRRRSHEGRRPGRRHAEGQEQGQEQGHQVGYDGHGAPAAGRRRVLPGAARPVVLVRRVERPRAPAAKVSDAIDDALVRIRVTARFSSSRSRRGSGRPGSRNRSRPHDVWHGMWAASLPGTPPVRERHGGRTVYDARDVFLRLASSRPCPAGSVPSCRASRAAGRASVTRWSR